MGGLALQILGLWVAATPYHYVLEDPRYDDKGPGSYVYPTGQPYTPGSFDLRRFEVEQDGAFVVFKVTFRAPLRRPNEVRRSDAIRIELENQIYVQNVDIYIDQDPSPEAGTSEAIPGRNVRFEDDARWEKAVVLAPLPFQVRSALSGWTEAGRVIVPSDLRGRGATVTARVSLDQLGAAPERAWGYQVLVSGAVWDPSFDAVQRLFGEHQPNAFTMRVATVAEPLAFGGGEIGAFHPCVLDLLAPSGRSQSSILKAWSAEDRVLAAIPMIYPDPMAFEAAQKARAPREVPVLPTLSVESHLGYTEARVRNVQGEIVVLDKPDQAVAPLSIGSVYDAEQKVVGQVVLTATYPDFLLATPVAGKERLAKGQTVRFERPKE